MSEARACIYCQHLRPTEDAFGVCVGPPVCAHFVDPVNAQQRQCGEVRYALAVDENGDFVACPGFAEKGAPETCIQCQHILSNGGCTVSLDRVVEDEECEDFEQR